MRTLDEIKNNVRIMDVEPHSLIPWPDTYAAVCRLPNGLIGSVVFGYNEDSWEHVSFAPFKTRITPSWDDMCQIKDIFFYDDEAAIQIHPAKSEYVNVKRNCLHLWRYKDIPLPK